MQNPIPSETGSDLAPLPQATSSLVTLPTQYQTFIHQSRYARYLPEEKRRERWDETVARYFDFFEGHLQRRCNFTLDSTARRELEEAVLHLEVMPSMRCLMTAGKALERDEVAGYNCSFIALDSPRAFDETMYVLMCGTGVGFSCEYQFVSRLPTLAPVIEDVEETVVVEDSKIGWATAFRKLIESLYAGKIPRWDVSKLREAGARLKTFGGRASGPKPLVQLFEFVVTIFRGAVGRKLSTIECHDIMCKVGEIVVVGGVRRSALISLSDLGDEWMRGAKAGAWWEKNGQRALANNSAVYEKTPLRPIFDLEWQSLIESQSGERGIFNREAARRHIAKLGRRISDLSWGCNPCSEILLRSLQFCNLSEVVCRAKDTLKTLKRKIRIATILGTIQSTLNSFRYLRDEWRKNTEEERLLGVSLTGIMDCEFLRNCSGEELKELRDYAVKVNHEWAHKLGIEVSAAVTCVKPSGTTSAIVDSASGIHRRYAERYIRTVRGDKKDPLTQFLQIAKVPHEDCVMKPDSTVVFSFPQKSPEGAPTRNDDTVINQLEIWLKFQRHWCEHKPSVTINVRPEEWEEAGNWVYEHFDEVSGISFLPHSEHTYKQAPYQECDEATYQKLLAQMPQINWEDLATIETEDSTSGTQTLACSGGNCDVVDIGA